MSTAFKKIHRLVSMVAALAALAVTAPAIAGGVNANPQDVVADQANGTDRLIIKYRKGTVAAARADLQTMSDAHTKVNRTGAQMQFLRRNTAGSYVMKLDRELGRKAIEALAQAIAASPEVEFAQPDRKMHILLTADDTRYLDQWHYYESAGGLNLPSAWDQTTGAGIVVAVIDTGYRPHADLAANLVPGYDMIIDTGLSNDNDGRDSDASDPGDWTTAGQCGFLSRASSSSWHGTHVAGTIAAVTNNANGVAGAAYGAKVQPVRALGRCGGYTSDVADGIIWASGGTVTGLPPNPTPARVISMSLGGSGACDATTQAAINSARDRGTVIVVAAGNSNVDVSNASPANCAGVVAVAAVGRTGGKAYYSNYGAGVDVAAPGGDTTGGVLSTLNTGTTTPGADSYAYYQGTSMATPHVSAVVALMLAKNPGLTPDQVEGALKGTSRAFPAACAQCGAGIVDANAAVTIALTFASLPAVTTNAASNITATGATLNSTTTANGSNTTVSFDYGTTSTSYASTSRSATTGGTVDTTGASTLAVSGLVCNTRYYFRAKGVSSAGSSTGSELSFLTAACAPAVTTGAATSITTTSATLSSTITANGGSTAVSFEYGTASGSYSTTGLAATPSAVTTTGSATRALSGLACSSTYYFRAKGVSSGGTVYGNERSFSTLTCGTVSPVTETTSNNNSASGAQVITANPVSINGSISSSTDTDYYRLTVGAGKTLTASLTMASNVDFDLYLYNSTGSTQITRSILGTGLTDQLSYTNTGSAAVTVYLRVTRYSRTGNYTLSASQ
jgi:serine protease